MVARAFFPGLVMLALLCAEPVRARIVTVPILISGNSAGVWRGGDEDPGQAAMLEAALQQHDAKQGVWIDVGGHGWRNPWVRHSLLPTADVHFPQTSEISRIHKNNGRNVPWLGASFCLPAFASANSQAPLPAALVFHRQGLRIRVCGLLSPDAPRHLPSASLQCLGVLHKKDVLRDMLPRWREDPADIQILIADLPEEDSKTLVREVPDMDAVLALTGRSGLRGNLLVPAKNGRVLTRLLVDYDTVRRRVSALRIEQLPLKQLDRALPRSAHIDQLDLIYACPKVTRFRVSEIPAEQLPMLGNDLVSRGAAIAGMDGVAVDPDGVKLTKTKREWLASRSFHPDDILRLYWPKDMFLLEAKMTTGELSALTAKLSPQQRTCLPTVRAAGGEMPTVALPETWFALEGGNPDLVTWAADRPELFTGRRFSYRALAFSALQEGRLP